MCPLVAFAVAGVEDRCEGPGASFRRSSFVFVARARVGPGVARGISCGITELSSAVRLR